MNKNTSQNTMPQFIIEKCESYIPEKKMKSLEHSIT